MRDASCRMLVLAITLGFTAGCVPTMPSPPGEADVIAQFHNLNAGALKEQVKSAANACEWRLDALVAKSRRQRDWGNAFAVIGATGGVTSASFSAALDDDGAKKATAIAAGGFAVVAAGAKLLGDPSNQLKGYDVAYAHYQRAARISDRIAAGIDMPEVKSQPALTSTNAPGPAVEPEPGANVAAAGPPAPARPALAGDRWTTLVLEMLDELRLCSSENPSIEAKK